MKIILILGTVFKLDEDIPKDIAEAEFNLNWCNQVPHWKYLSEEGVCFFKELTHLDTCQKLHCLFQQGVLSFEHLCNCLNYTKDYPCNEKNSLKDKMKGGKTK